MDFSVVILGASGYTGAELIRLIINHPKLTITGLSGDRKAGLKFEEVFPHLNYPNLPVLKKIEEIDFSSVDLCFCALPHKTSQEVIVNLPKDLKVIDLSADFRLKNPQMYKKWYGSKHIAPELQKEFVYGLTEFYREKIKLARLVSGTGCNAAAGQYALRPLISAGMISIENIIIDLKAGVSGAGRSLKENLLHAELSEGTHPYSIGGTHRHLAEFDQELSELAGKPVQIQFTPHLVPMNRGILATVYVEGDPKKIHSEIRNFYHREHFVKVLPKVGEFPSTHHVRGSNLVKIGVSADRIPNKTIIVVALDNLTKGSSGQAIQNANIMLGIDEHLGLNLVPLFP